MLQVTAENKTGHELEQEVDAELHEFDEWFQRGGQLNGASNDPLSRPEIAILKTFCWWLLNLRAKEEEPVTKTVPAPPPSTADESSLV